MRDPPAERQAERLHARQAAARLTHRLGDRARDLDVARLEVDVEGDERPPGTDEDGTGGRIEPRRPEVGRELAGVDTSLEPLRPAPPENMGRRPSPLSP